MATKAKITLAEHERRVWAGFRAKCIADGADEETASDAADALIVEARRIEKEHFGTEPHAQEP